MAKTGKQVDAAAEVGAAAEVTETVEVAFRWTGSPVTVRTIEKYVWSPDNGFIQVVNLDMAAKLLTYPIEGEFVPVAGQQFSEQALQQLAQLCGGTVEEVRELLGVNSVGDEAVGD